MKTLDDIKLVNHADWYFCPECQSITLEPATPFSKPQAQCSHQKEWTGWVEWL